MRLPPPEARSVSPTRRSRDTLRRLSKTTNAPFGDEVEWNVRECPNCAHLGRSKARAPRPKADAACVWAYLGADYVIGEREVWRTDD